MPEKIDAGMLCAVEPLKINVADVLLASIDPDVRVIDEPVYFNVRAPITSVPFVSVTSPDIVGLLLKV